MRYITSILQRRKDETVVCSLTASGRKVRPLTDKEAEAWASDDDDWVDPRLAELGLSGWDEDPIVKHAVEPKECNDNEA